MRAPATVCRTRQECLARLNPNSRDAESLSGDGDDPVLPELLNGRRRRRRPMLARAPTAPGVDRRTAGRDRSHVRERHGRGGLAAGHADPNPSAAPERAATAASPGRRSDASTTGSQGDDLERARDGLPGRSRLVRSDCGLCAIPAHGLGTRAAVTARGSHPVAQALRSVGLGWSQKLGRYTGASQSNPVSQSIPVRCAHGQRPPRPRDA
jgi:hypothetical protein